MINERTLREEILSTARRWPVLVLCCLVGGLLGWVVSYQWPSPYRATKELYVGITVKRASSDRHSAQGGELQLLNVDDYKNWQMANLNSLIYTDPIIDETLSRLRGNDPHWASVNRRQLSAMLHAYWRNAGKWRLVAEASDPRRAAQAVSAWHDVVVETVHRAVGESRLITQIDNQLQSLSNTQARINSQIAGLSHLLALFGSWREYMYNLPANQQLSPELRWQLWYLCAQPDLGAGWKSLQDQYPLPEALPKDYLAWIDRAISALNQGIGTLQAQAADLAAQKGQAANEYTNGLQKSLGLSADLQVDPITDEPPVITVVRPTGLMTLVGAWLGFIIWALVAITTISQRVRDL
jgi:hypothetical protein